MDITPSTFVRQYIVSFFVKIRDIIATLNDIGNCYEEVTAEAWGGYIKSEIMAMNNGPNITDDQLVELGILAGMTFSENNIRFSGSGSLLVVI